MLSTVCLWKRVERTGGALEKRENERRMYKRKGKDGPSRSQTATQTLRCPKNVKDLGLSFLSVSLFLTVSAGCDRSASGVRRSASLDSRYPTPTPPGPRNARRCFAHFEFRAQTARGEISAPELDDRGASSRHQGHARADARPKVGRCKSGEKKKKTVRRAPER